MKKLFVCTLSLLFVVILVGACISKSAAPVEATEVNDEQQAEVVDSLAVADQASAEAVEQ